VSPRGNSERPRRGAIPSGRGRAQARRFPDGELLVEEEDDHRGIEVPGGKGESWRSPALPGSVTVRIVLTLVGRRVLRRSDDAAARRVHTSIGAQGMRLLAYRARNAPLHAGPGIWGVSTIDASDQARYFLRIDRLVPARHRAYAMGLLASITPWQRWGIARVRPAGWHLASMVAGAGLLSPAGSITKSGCLRAAMSASRSRSSRTSTGATPKARRPCAESAPACSEAFRARSTSPDPKHFGSGEPFSLLGGEVVRQREHSLCMTASRASRNLGAIRQLDHEGRGAWECDVLPGRSTARVAWPLLRR
jgi:hypothetical protein